MSFQYFLCKQKLFSVFLLNKFLCDDVIILVIQLLFPNSLIVQRKRLLKEIHEEKEKSDKLGGYNYTIMWDIKPRYGMIYQTKTIKKFINDNHDQLCSCHQCLSRYDFPRYSYLIQKCRYPKYGDNSSLVNNWFLFLSYISGNMGVPERKLLSNIINNTPEDKNYGFISKYDLNYNIFKKKKRDETIKNIRLKYDKNRWIQLLHIWENIQLF